MKPSKITALFALMLLLFSTAHGKELGVVYRNNMAVGKIQRERVLDAYEEFLSLLGRSPFDPTLQFNVGSSLSLLGEAEKAATLYKQLLVQVDELIRNSHDDADLLKELYAVRFGILYNLGVHYQSLQEIEPALNYYQLALELNPDSKEIKTNIEMMVGQGQGKGKDKKDDKGKGEGEGKDKKEDPKDGDGKEKKPPEPQKGKGKKEFDQKQMSMEDLKRIMEELKQQEQGIRAKFQGKGGQNGNKEKEW
jgi:tetratricopeptide (TPR) repeat protein